jgi:cell division protein FtsB
MKTIVIILALLLAWIGIAAVNGASQAAGQVNVSKFVNGGVKLSNYGGIKLTTNLKSFLQA